MLSGVQQLYSLPNVCKYLELFAKVHLSTELAFSKTAATFFLYTKSGIRSEKKGSTSNPVNNTLRLFNSWENCPLTLSEMKHETGKMVIRVDSQVTERLCSECSS